jgi:muconolactone D-isomerase
MLYLVHMSVRTPLQSEQGAFEDAKDREREVALELQRDGRWLHLWRVVGRYENYSVFDVQSNAELHNILAALPLFPWMDINVIPLAPHPSRYVP